MKRILFIGVLAVFLTTPVFADMRLDVQNKAAGNTNGGPFNVSSIGTDPIGIYTDATIFTTFCIELNETLAYTDYSVLVNDGAIMGGVGGDIEAYGGLTLDPISMGTTRLYENWILNLSPVERADDDIADNYQNAIWHLEGEITATGAALALAESVDELGENPFLTDNNGFLTRAINPFSGAATIDDPDAIMHQSLLVLEEGDDIVVPVPGALLLGFLGLSAAGIKLRKYA